MGSSFRRIYAVFFNSLSHQTVTSEPLCNAFRCSMDGPLMGSLGCAVCAHADSASMPRTKARPDVNVLRSIVEGTPDLGLGRLAVFCGRHTLHLQPSLLSR